VRAQPIPRSLVAGILLCFFLSGAAGLVYQVAWGKALGLIFGHTVYAIATVLAVFMGGLALGSAFIGSWSERHAKPVALYAWVEFGIAATGAVSLLGLAGVRKLYLAGYQLAAVFPAGLVALRFFASAAVLLLPTVLMGGTLPILVRGLARSSTELGARISRLYWVNTLGAVAGTLAAGFLFLPVLGLRRTIAAAVGMNLVAGTMALWLARTRQPEAATEIDTSAGEPLQLSRFLLLSFAAVGATAMAYEVAWSRMLATMLGSSTYAFTLMLATFLAGIGLGSLVFESWARRVRKAHLATFAATQTLTGLAALMFLVFFQRLPQVVPPLLRATHETFGGLVLAQFVTSALAMFPAALVFGFNFPLVTLLLVGRPEASRRRAEAVGCAYAANTLGAILGATTTGFWLLPLLGSYRLVALTAIVNLALAGLLQLRRSPQQLPALVFNSVLLGVAALTGWRGTFYDRDLANFGTVLYWDLYDKPLTLAETAATTDIVFAEDGLNASIAVVRADDYIALRTNGKVDASNHDKLTQLLVGHLGPLFHPAAKRVLIIGFGSGMTVSAVSLYPEVERIDCVEIEPAVLRAAPYLGPLNRGVLRDPRVHIILDDARNFLLATPNTYDLIISEPSNPWIAGVATLFTDEFYREVRARLAPAGVLVQWVQAYSLYAEDLRMVLTTLLAHFPQVTAWRGESEDLLLLAQTDPKPLTLDRLRRLWSFPGLQTDYKALSLHKPEGLLAYYLLDDPDLRNLVGQTARNTDDHTQLEYRAPRALLASGLGEKNMDMVREQQSDLLPQLLRIEDQRTALLASAETLLDLEENDAAGELLEEAAEGPPHPVAELLRGRWHLAAGRLAEAKVAFQTALQLDPSSLAAAHGLAEVAHQKSDFLTAELLLRQIVIRNPGFVPALESFAKLERAREDWKEAAEWQERRIAADSDSTADEYALLGQFLFRAGDDQAAERALFLALERDPYSSKAHGNLGDLYRNRGRWEKAAQHLELVVRYDPTSDSSVYASLAEAYRALGRPRDAERALAKRRRLFPGESSAAAAPS